MIRTVILDLTHKNADGVVRGLSINMDHVMSFEACGYGETDAEKERCYFNLDGDVKHLAVESYDFVVQLLRKVR